MESKQYPDIKPEKQALYYEQTQKRTLKQKYVKVRNTILALLAYRCPLNGLRVWMQRRRGVHVGKHVYIGMFCYLDNLAPEYIYIEDKASINAGSMILTHFDPLEHYAPVFEARIAPVLIKEGAIVAVRSTILPGVSVGKYAVVSAGSVVEKNVDDYTMVKGNPCKVVAEYSALMN